MTGKIKWLVAILALSLAANVFVAGMMLGKEARRGPPPHGGKPGIDFNIKRFGKYLNEEERAKVRKILRSERRELGGRYRAVKTSERRIKDLIAAEQVDRSALLEALEAHAALMRELHGPMQRVMMEVIAELDHNTRSQLADEMFKRRPRFDGERLRKFEGPDGKRRPPRRSDHGGDRPQDSPTEDEPEEGST